MEKFWKILPNGQAYPQSDTIDKMAYAIHGFELQMIIVVAQQEHR